MFNIIQLISGGSNPSSLPLDTLTTLDSDRTRHVPTPTPTSRHVTLVNLLSKMIAMEFVLHRICQKNLLESIGKLMSGMNYLPAHGLFSFGP